MSTKYYAVKNGRQTGIFTDWTTTKKAVDGYSDAQYKSFKDLNEAKTYLKTKPQLNQTTVTAQTDLNPKNFDAILYTDGGCRIDHNQKGNHVNKNDLSAWAYELKAGDHRYQDSKAYRGFTNNQMELTGIIWGLRQLKARHYQDQKTLLVSDSHYAIDPIQDGRLNQWAHNDWKTKANQPVKNQKYWQTIHALLPDFKDLTIHWTKGHANNLGNNHVDELLNKSMDKLSQREANNDLEK